MTQAEIREVIEIGAPIPAESASPIFVTAPVLENYPVVVGSVQPVPAAAHAAPVVECVIPAPMVTNGVLTIGTDAWVQVVNDDARAQERVSS